MRILNLGSLNIDKTYEVTHFVEAKETVKALAYREFCGGKGLNQSIAIARAGASVVQGGCVGTDGDALVESLQQAGVDTSKISRSDGPSGHAIIQIDDEGQNCIVICGGANDLVTKDYIDDLLQMFEPGDMFLLQNETSNVGYAIRKAHEKGMTVIFNPSPINDALMELDLHNVDMFVLNEVEGRALANITSEDVEEILSALRQAFPTAAFVLTVGEQGAWYSSKETTLHSEAHRVHAVDTTAAGDTYTGYLLAELSRGQSIDTAMDYASIAAAIAVSRRGASTSIPVMEEVKRAYLGA